MLWADMPPPADHPASDIRQYLSPVRALGHVTARATPQPTPVRRRIIHDSDDSDHAQEPVRPEMLPVDAASAPMHNVVQVADDTSGNDDIWVAPILRQTDSVRAPLTPNAADADRDRAPVNFPVRRNPSKYIQQTVGGRAPLTPIASHVDRDHAPRTARDRSQPVRRSRSCFEGAAEEDDDRSDSSSVDESDDDAVDLYRSAMMGVRNRPNAMLQSRASSTPCAACAHFGKFLRYFL